MTKNLRKIYALFFLLLTMAGCSASPNEYMFGEPFFGSPDAVKVEKGDTLYSISRLYDVDVTSLSKLNNLKAPYALSIGDTLQLPASVNSPDEDDDIAEEDSQTIVKPVSSSTPAAQAQRTSTSKQTVLKSEAKTPAKKTLSKNAVPKKANNRRAATVKKKTTQSSTQTQAQRRYAASTTVDKKRKEKFSWPIKGEIISQYGVIGKGRKNDGINIKAREGAIVSAADGGTVVYAGNELKGFGNLILIKHSDGFITAYAHNDKIYVRKGQSVRRGQKISTVGKTGGVNIPQLHFEVHIGKKPVNPMNYLK